MLYEAEANAKGERMIWLEDAGIWRLASMRGPRGTFSHVIIEAGGGRTRVTEWV
jgi:hypothetical protein